MPPPSADGITLMHESPTGSLIQQSYGYDVSCFFSEKFGMYLIGSHDRFTYTVPGEHRHM